MLELLIVGVLTSVLMLGVWSLFRTWGRLYERGALRVEAAQLQRSLCDQFSDDVRAVVFVDPATLIRPSRRGGTTRVPQGGGPGLVGGATWLVVDVLQPPDPFSLPVADLDATGEEPLALAAPELRRIVYTFEPPQDESLDSLSSTVSELAALDDTELVGAGDESDEQEVPPSGLLRLELATEQYEALMTPPEEEPGPRRGLGWQEAAWQLRGLALGVEADLSGTGMSFSSTTIGTAGGKSGAKQLGILSQDEVPEVVWFELRYYDGRQWVGSWDSRSAGRLPVAIEMRFELRQEKLEEQGVVSSGETELVEDQLAQSGSLEELFPSEPDAALTLDAAADLGGPVPEEPPYVRCLVFLEGAQHEQ